MTDAGTIETGQSSFDEETKAFLFSELEELGAESIVHGLQAILMMESGEVVHNGATQEMRDGTAAAAVGNADIVALVCGYPREAEDPEIAEHLEPYKEELLATEGLADLAERALTHVSDQSSEDFRHAKGTMATEAEFQRLVASVLARVKQAKVEFPKAWIYEPIPGAFEVTTYDVAEEGADNE
ncbi:MAG: hypothetical protein ACR2OY_00510 [Boseongicola sp.]